MKRMNDRGLSGLCPFAVDVDRILIFINFLPSYSIYLLVYLCILILFPLFLIFLLIFFDIY